MSNLRWRYPFYWVATRDWFDVISFTVITFNMIIVIWDVILIYTSDYNHDQCKWTPKELRTKHAFVYTNYVFAVYYTLELLINLIGLGFKIYFCNLWHYLDIVVLIVTYADIYLYEIALKPEICYHDQALQYNVREYLNIIKGLRLLQFIRSLKLLRVRILQIQDMQYQIILIQEYFWIFKIILFCVDLASCAYNFAQDTKAHQLSNFHRIRYGKRVCGDE